MTSLINTASRNNQFNRYTFLVERIVRKLSYTYPSHEDIEDMKQYGYMGLIESIHRFQPEKGVKFESYATIRIQGSILDAKRKADWVPRSVRGTVKEIKYVTQELKGKLRREPSSEEMAEAMGMSVNGFMKLQGKLDIRKPLRLDQEDENGTTLGSIVLSNEKNPEEEAFNNAMIARLQSAKGMLTEREQQVIQWYYYDGINFKDISRRLGVTESRISQIHSNICRQLATRIAA
jgi:RNA polymerase sigma factor for flagellar operon FliA